MTTPERDPLGDMFDQYAAATAAETTRSTTGQLRRRMHRHRAGRFAAVGVAAAVLAVPGVWALQNAGADEPVGAADQGAAEPSEEAATCPMTVLTMTPIVDAEGTELEEFIASEEARAMMLALPEGSEIRGYRDDPEIKIVVIPGDVDLDGYLDVEEYGFTLASEEEFVVAVYEEARAEELAADCVDPTGEEPSEESGTPGDEPTEEGSETGELPTESAGAPTDAGEEPTEAGEEEPTGESTPGGGDEPTTGDDEEPSASEESTP
ncbi:hypothetical protein O1R50_22535 [Glycomyces luteolus]|uniref:Uncharacterized protein n=1 Tax=Glycomyces luteolus TaxID=2670330 RepID=A0A9X3PGY3_9ACTN|nr:hypothetical protein [Glycomyces luteolus]MDA1362419.1 hypothetical protein [Glycomyces luteolus]